mmetsp:Transcript_49590/g.121006  ORF Transcript_49590/g.121006 Transcript_49590/m.121006 type:complete len:97 (-) Transcript_49590:53-343(-)
MERLREDDASITEGCEGVVGAFSEELEPCEDWGELLDVAGLLGDLPAEAQLDPAAWLEGSVQAAPPTPERAAPSPSAARSLNDSIEDAQEPVPEAL